jgi:lipopolysaccharide/colanic/teichoic acid biosynthesis glycosyltransferase
MYAKYIKRPLDFVLALCAFVILLPIMIILAIIGAIIMKGNPFYVQPRPGKNERIFRLIKFRTMTCEKDENGNLLPDEKRLTKYGKFLRSTSLDELPELINIIKGDMSIVGPRPQLVRDMVFMNSEQRARHTVRPGLTGLAQVNGRNNITWEQKFEYDLQYIERITFLRDIKIILKSVSTVLKRADIIRDGTASDIDFGDWLVQQGIVSIDEYREKQKEAKDLMNAK